MSAKGATKVSPLSLDLAQKGISVTPIIGLDYKVGNFNFAAKYEFRAVTNLKNNTKRSQKNNIMKKKLKYKNLKAFHFKKK
jgi:hypothetical protein